MSAAPIALSFGRSPRTPSGLLAEARRGNAEAFAEMVSPYLPALHRRARGFTGNSADAEDVSQETMLKAWSRLGQFAGKQEHSIDEFRAWISRIATNSSIDLLRQRREGRIASLDERKGQSDEPLGNEIAGDIQDPEERCARREMGRLLAKAILQLPPDLRQTCLLRDVMHYSTQEVADSLGISIVAVRLRLFRAHRRLRERLQGSLQLRSKRPEPRSETRSGSRRFVPIGAVPEYMSGD